MSMQPATSELSNTTERIPLRKIAIATIVAAIAAAIVNAIVFLIADAAGAMPESVKVDNPGGGSSSIELATVVTVTIYPLLLAGVLLAVLARFSKRPLQLFWVISAVVLVLSFFEPFVFLDDAPGDMIAALLTMHVVAAVVGVGVITYMVRR